MVIDPLSQETIQDVLKRWHEPDPASPLDSLILIRGTVSGQTPHARINQLLLALLDQMEARNPELATVLKLRFIDGMAAFQVANRLNISEPTLYRKQKEAIAWLTVLLTEKEEEAQRVHMARLSARLDGRSYEKLFGVDQHLDHLCQRLDTDDPPWLLLLTGIGGIGKTALADALIRRLVQSSHFANFAWTTARQQQIQLDGALLPVTNPALTAEALLENLAHQLLDEPLPAPFSVEKVTDLLRNRLKERPHLVVVDNLETVQDVRSLLPLLRQMAEPSKFILTSRQSIPSAAYLYHYPVPALSLDDALALVRYEAANRNLSFLTQAGDDDLRPIYEIVGGNPLALRLVVGQTHHYPLSTVLEKLSNARGASSEALFSYIYRWAWDLLDDNAQQLFLCLPLLPATGADLGFLSTISGLDENQFHSALESLLRLNLLDHRTHSLYHSVYTIHSLTRTFLLQEVIRWPR